MKRTSKLLFDHETWNRRKAAVQLGKAYERKMFDYNDSTNRVNRNSYTAAHLEAIGMRNSKQLNVIQFEDSRTPAVNHGADQFPTGVGKSLVWDCISDHSSRPPMDNMLWRSWELSHTQIPDDVDSRTDHDRYLPKQWRLNTLKYQVPLRHRLVNEFEHNIIPKVRRYDNGEYEVDKFAEWLGHRLTAVVGSVCSTDQQRTLLLAYLLHIIGSKPDTEDPKIKHGRCLNIKLALLLYELLACRCAYVHYPHLAILLHVSNARQLNTHSKEVLAVLKKERQFNNGVIHSSLLPVTLELAHQQRLNWEDCLRLAAKADVNDISLACWGRMIKTVGEAPDAPFEAVQKVVDYATEVKPDNMKNIELWNSYISQSPCWKHAIEMVQLNMPHYQLQPDFGTFDALLRSMKRTTRDGKAVDNDLYVRVFRKAMKLADDSDRIRVKQMAVDLVRKMKADGGEEHLKNLSTDYRSVKRAYADKQEGPSQGSNKHSKISPQPKS